MKEIVVFDLDGTLLSGDSTKAWLTDKLKSNIFRFIAALIVTPIALPIMKFKKYKSKGASLYLWIATYGLNEEKLEYSFRNFSKNIKNNSFNSLYWFEQGINEVKDHLANRRIVFIATYGCTRKVSECFTRFYQSRCTNYWYSSTKQAGRMDKWDTLQV